MQARVSMRRIAQYLGSPELDPHWTKEICFEVESAEDSIQMPASMELFPLTEGNKSPGRGDPFSTQNLQGMAIVVSDASFTWCDSTKRDLQIATLKNISLSIPRGSLVVIMGKVGLMVCHLLFWCFFFFCSSSSSCSQCCTYDYMCHNWSHKESRRCGVFLVAMRRMVIIHSQSPSRLVYLKPRNQYEILLCPSLNASSHWLCMLITLRVLMLGFK